MCNCTVCGLNVSLAYLSMAAGKTLLSVNLQMYIFLKYSGTSIIEGLRDRQNLFAITRFHYIAVLSHIIILLLMGSIKSFIILRTLLYISRLHCSRCVT